MKLLWKLLVAQLIRRPARYLLTTLAIIASAGVVIWVVSGYDALVAQFDDFSDEYLGRYQFVIVPDITVSPSASVGAPKISAEILTQVAADSAIELLDSEVHLQVKIESPRGPAAPGSGRPRGKGPGTGGSPGGGRADDKLASSSGDKSSGKRSKMKGVGGVDPTSPRAYGPPPSPTLVGTQAASPPHEIHAGRWLDFRSDIVEGVISQRAAEEHNIQLGDKVSVAYEQKIHSVEIVGIIGQLRGIQGGGRFAPGPSRGPALQALYVPVAVVELLTQQKAAPSIAQVLLKDAEQPSAFRARWERKFAAATPPLAIMSAEDVQDDLDSSRSASSARNQAYSATGIALLASLFIIFSALSMGVSERARQFVVLRAIALSPWQIGAIIVVESLLLGMVGWIGGIASGWLLLFGMSYAQPQLFSAGVSLGSWCIALSGVCALGGSLAAAAIPAYRAMRISPIDALGTSAAQPTTRWNSTLAIVGLLLISINPLLVFAWPMKDDARYPIYVALGCTSMALGFILLAPAATLLTEKLLGPVVARLCGLDRRLLQSELSANLWRTVGTCVALTLGLGLFVSTQIWGYSMLEPFVPGKWVPDLIVSFTTGGLPDREFETVAKVAGLRPGTCLPAAVEQTRLAQDYTGSAERNSVARQDNVIVVGLDPARAFSNDNSLFDLKFVAGDAARASQAMAARRGCLIPDHFARESGLSLGDKVEVIPPEAPDTTVSYTIAGIVELPGWHWMTKFSGLRRRSGRSAGIVFANFETVRQDYGLEGINFFFTKLDSDADLDAIGTTMTEIADRYPGDRQPTNAQGLWTIGAMDYGPAIRLSTPHQVTTLINNRASGMIWGMCQLPLVTLVISGLGVINTVMASIRARTWNFGVMRAVGLSRSALARLVLAESLLIALVACILSLAFGILAGWCGAGISQYVSFFGGLNPSLVVPWQPISIGLAATIAICLVAALWPAWRVARTEPLELMQAGRGSM